MHPGFGVVTAVTVRVRQRAAASCDARAAWIEAWGVVSGLRLEALELGHPPPPLTPPYLELHLPEGLPEELPPSFDRCSACQGLLDEVRLGGCWQPLHNQVQEAGQHHSRVHAPA